ncbi:glycine betaine/L-proline ABC transporter ATP-binding protein, partial [Tetragenococcus halophilus]
MGKKVRVEHLSKIFGRRTQQALEQVKAGKSKQEILKETGATVGVHDVSFDVN